MSIVIDLARLEKLASKRKMSVGEVVGEAEIKGASANCIKLESMRELQLIADKLLMPLSELLGGVGSDLDAGVAVYKAHQGFVKEVSREGSKYYTYQHLATSNTAPELMALKVLLHCESDEKICLNSGHLSREIVYVLKGCVRVDWYDKGTASIRNGTLNEGDSIYISPGVEHSFIAIELGAEILAFNYELS